MKKKTLYKKLHLNDQVFENIKKTVADVEYKTTGEIALALAPESAHYSFWELLAANIFAAFLLLVLLQMFLYICVS